MMLSRNSRFQKGYMMCPERAAGFKPEFRDLRAQAAMSYPHQRCLPGLIILSLSDTAKEQHI